MTTTRGWSSCPTATTPAAATMRRTTPAKAPSRSGRPRLTVCSAPTSAHTRPFPSGCMAPAPAPPQGAATTRRRGRTAGRTARSGRATSGGPGPTRWTSRRRRRWIRSQRRRHRRHRRRASGRTRWETARQRRRAVRRSRKRRRRRRPARRPSAEPAPRHQLGLEVVCFGEMAAGPGWIVLLQERVPVAQKLATH